VSNWFHDHVGEGDELELTRPAGVFCVRDHDAPVVAFSGGSGVTPVMSVVKSLMATTTRTVRVLHANRDLPSVIFDPQLHELEARHGDRLQLHRHLDSDGGFLDAASIRAFVEGILDADFYICGPAPFMDLVETTLHDLGVADDQILIERFAAPEPAAPVADGSPPTASADEATVVTILLKGASTEIAYHQGDTVLETARRGGLQPPFSCEAGNCATCMAFLREGGATMRTNNALTPEEVAEGWILTCQALPDGAVTVEYEDL
jgi:ferredoxin-NADP reductase